MTYDFLYTIPYSENIAEQVRTNPELAKKNLFKKFDCNRFYDIEYNIQLITQNAVFMMNANDELPYNRNELIQELAIFTPDLMFLARIKVKCEWQFRAIALGKSIVMEGES